MFVAHGRYLSQYYLDEEDEQCFKLNKNGHKHFNYYITMLFKFYKVNPDTKIKHFSVGVLLENGEIHVLQNENTSDYKSWKLVRE